LWDFLGLSSRLSRIFWSRIPRPDVILFISVVLFACISPFLCCLVHLFLFLTPRSFHRNRFIFWMTNIFSLNGATSDEFMLQSVTANLSFLRNSLVWAEYFHFFLDYFHQHYFLVMFPVHLGGPTRSELLDQFSHVSRRRSWYGFWRWELLHLDSNDSDSD
jgi:hypothetical protein